MLELAIENENSVRGSLYLNDTSMRGFTKLDPSIISINEYFHPERQRVESFIEETFSRAYGAQLPGHYSTLMSVRNRKGDILAAVGFRAAGAGPLFLEQYLPDPIDQMLQQRLGTTMSRGGIVEIGSLASAGGGASIFLFIALVAYLKSQGYEYASVTATRGLRSAFRFLGLEALDLGGADKALLPDGGACWGTYYDTNPRVLVGALGRTFERLEHFVPADKNQNMARLFTRLHFDTKGEQA